MSADESREASAPGESPEKPTLQSASRVALWPWLLLLALFGGVLVFLDLGGGPIEVYDEGLYGRHAQSALAHDVYLHAVDTHGSFPTGDIKFSKPPLSIWVSAASMALFGPTLFALRLPFALATFITALIAFAWGVRLERGRPWLGLCWGLLFLASHGAYHFGRTATIDALLLAFVMLALYAHARAIDSRGASSVLFCLLAGSGIALAFLTKQLVCALAALPIAIVELSRMRREGFVRPFVRASISLGLPLVIAAGWVAMLWSKLGPATRDVLWSHAIVKRVRGFDGIHHHNYLNRIAEQLDLDAAPFAWALGVLGLVLFVAERQRARTLSADAWLLAGTFACSWLAFDVGSQAILPWYAFTLLMPLAFGNALLITRGCTALLEHARPERAAARWTLLSVVLAASGAAALALAVTDATRSYLPAPLTAASVSAVIAAWAYASPAQLPRRFWLGLGALFLLSYQGLLFRERYAYAEADPASVLGSGLAKLGAKRISVDSRAGIHDYTRVTFFGVRATNEGAIWSASGAASGKRGKNKATDARVEAEVLPREAHGIEGQHILRAAGMFAVHGPLTEHPFKLEAADSALSAGPLTYEAEDLASTRFDSLVYRSSASGGALRRMASWPRRRPESFKLAAGTLSELPRGMYRAVFDIRADCGLLRGARLGEIAVTNLGSPIAALPVQCAGKGDASADDGPITLKFTLLAPSRIGIVLRYDQGTISFDRFTLKRETMPP